MQQLYAESYECTVHHDRKGVSCRLDKYVTNLRSFFHMRMNFGYMLKGSFLFCLKLLIKYANDEQMLKMYLLLDHETRVSSRIVEIELKKLAPQMCCFIRVDPETVASENGICLIQIMCHIMIFFYKGFTKKR
jgi:hypothetical protein